MDISPARRIVPLLFVVATSAATSHTVGSRSAESLCTQAAPGRARTIHVDSVLAFTGAGSAQMPDGTLLVAWTGVDCVGWFRLRGNMSVDTSWRRVIVPPGGRFVAHEETPRGRRDYTLDPDGRATMSVDDRPVSADSSQREWIDALVREFVRRSGVDAGRRANAILQRGGVQGLIEEAGHIPNAAVRAEYLRVGFKAVDSSGRVAFLRTGSDLLDDPFARTSYLRAVPHAWLAEERVLQAVYDEAARVEPDDLVEQILRSMPPPRPAPASLTASLNRLIGTLQNSERRAALRALYLTDRH